MHHTLPSPPPTPVFPPELCDLIIDHLHNDSASLLACALVCKSWLPRSRSHLFPEHFTFKLRQSNISKFRSCLEAHDAGFETFIRRIAVFSPWVQDVQLFDQLEDTVRYLLHLKAVSFTAAPDLILRKPTLIRMLSQSIMSLSLRCDSGGAEEGINGGEILEIVSSFSLKLEKLELELDTLGLWLAEPVQVHAPFPKLCMVRLRYLRLSVPWNSILPWLLLPDFAEFPLLDTLVVEIGNTQTRQGDRRLLQAFLDLCAGTVKELEIRFYYGSLPAIDLGKFISLRSLILKGWHFSNTNVQGIQSKIDKLISTVAKERAVCVEVKNEVKVVLRGKHNSNAPND
ncbi:hypothetical protein VNI00_004518 [Paramarasmius palmivorus]|uniref:F-box domain-containing protein n=1 Tax=Paramarasmius palmivorus TaxID=297713 RepID=A0AAW0DJF5_9AGAR